MGTAWFDMTMTDAGFAETISIELLPLLADHGFKVVECHASIIRLASPTMTAVAAFDRRGEFGLDIARSADPSERWSYNGMLGRASMQRLCELALEQLTADPRILRGDPEGFRAFRTKQEATRELP